MIDTWIIRSGTARSVSVDLQRSDAREQLAYTSLRHFSRCILTVAKRDVLKGIVDFQRTASPTHIHSNNVTAAAGFDSLYVVQASQQSSETAHIVVVVRRVMFPSMYKRYDAHSLVGLNRQRDLLRNEIELFCCIINLV